MLNVHEPKITLSHVTCTILVRSAHAHGVRVRYRLQYEAAITRNWRNVYSLSEQRSVILEHTYPDREKYIVRVI